MSRQLRYRRTHNLPLTAPFIDADQTAVQVMTAHKAKGLEFHTVFMPRATDKAFGGSDQRDYFKLPLYAERLSDADSEDDEKRLFYVAMTRAKENLFISSSINTASGKVCEPSRFIYQRAKRKSLNLSHYSIQATVLSNLSQILLNSCS